MPTAESGLPRGSSAEKRGATPFRARGIPRTNTPELAAEQGPRICPKTQRLGRAVKGAVLSMSLSSPVLRLWVFFWCLEKSCEIAAFVVQHSEIRGKTRLLCQPPPLPGSGVRGARASTARPC